MSVPVVGAAIHALICNVAFGTPGNSEAEDSTEDVESEGTDSSSGDEGSDDGSSEEDSDSGSA